MHGLPNVWIFLDQGLNSCLLHRQVDALPLSHQANRPLYYFSKTVGEKWNWMCVFKLSFNPKPLAVLFFKPLLSQACLLGGGNSWQPSLLTPSLPPCRLGAFCLMLHHPLPSPSPQVAVGSRQHPRVFSGPGLSHPAFPLSSLSIQSVSWAPLAYSERPSRCWTRDQLTGFSLKAAGPAV